MAARDCDCVLNKEREREREIYELEEGGGTDGGGSPPNKRESAGVYARAPVEHMQLPLLLHFLI